MNDHKQVNRVFDNIKRDLTDAKTAYVGPSIFQQGSEPLLLQPKHHPVLLLDKIISVLSSESGGVAKLPPDRYDRDHHVVHGGVDELTQLRVNTIIQILPEDNGVVVSYNTARDTDDTILVHDLRRGKFPVHYTRVTVRDLLRLVVEDESRQGAITVAARDAFQRISLKPGESWKAAAARMLQYYRAATATADSPANSEESIYCQVMPENILWMLLSKYTALCMPGQLDVTSCHSYRMLLEQTYSDALRRKPIITSQINSEHMIGRGQLVKHIFESYIKVVIKEGTRMVHGAPKAHSGNVNALLSNRLPPSLNMNPYEVSMAATTRKSSSVFAVADHDGEEEDACDEVATFNPNSEAPEKSSDQRQWGARKRSINEDEVPTGRENKRFLASGQQEKRDDSTFGKRSFFSQGGARNTSSARSSATGGGGGYARTSRGTRGTNPSRTSRDGRGPRPPRLAPAKLPAEAPRATDKEELITAYIMKHGVCFYHARGKRCPTMTAFGVCTYSHTQSPIPFGAYSRASAEESAEMASIAAEQSLYLGDIFGAVQATNDFNPTAHATIGQEMCDVAAAQDEVGQGSGAEDHDDDTCSK